MFIFIFLYIDSLSNRRLHLILTRADQILPFFGLCDSVPCIGYIRNIAIEGTALNYPDAYLQTLPKYRAASKSKHVMGSLAVEMT